MSQPKRNWRNYLALPLALVAFVFALVSGAVLHLNMPAARSAAVDLAEAWFNELFRGTATIVDLSRLAPGGITVRGLTVRDPDHRVVLEVAEVEVNVDVWAVAQRILRLHEKLTLAVDDVTVRSPKLYFLQTSDRDDDGLPLTHPSLSDAFESVEPAEQPKSVPRRSVRVWLENIRLEQVFARGSIMGSPTVEARVPLAEASLLATNKGAAIDVSEFELSATGLRGVDVSATGEIHVRAPGAVWGEVEGRLGDIPLSQAFRFEHDWIEVSGKLPSLKPVAVRPLVPDWPFDQPVSATNRIEGVPPRLDVDINLSASTGRLHTSGVVITEPELEAELDFETYDLDLSTLRHDLPASDLNMRSALSAWSGDGGMNVELNATVAETTVSSTQLPVIDVRASLVDQELDARATLHERGLPAKLSLAGPVDGPFEFSLDLKRTRLSESPRLQTLVDARGQVEGSLSGTFDGEEVTASVNLQGVGIAAEGASAAALQLSGEVLTPIDAPLSSTASLKIGVTTLRYGDFLLKRAALQAEGPVISPRFRFGGTTARDIDFELAGKTRTDRIELTDVSGQLNTPGKPLSLTVQRIAVTEENIVAEKLRMASEGSMVADLNLTRGGGRAEIEAKDLNLSRLTRNLGLSAAALSGRIDASVDVTIAESSRGEISIALRDGTVAGVPGVSLKSQSRLHGRRIRGSVEVAVEGLGHGDSSWDIKVPSPLSDLDGYSAATGKLELNLDELDLAGLDTLLAVSGLGRASGMINADAKLYRDRGDAFPHVEFNAGTENLSLDIETEDGPLRIDAVGIDVGSILDGEQGEAQLALRLKDGEGELLTVTGTTELPLERWMNAPPDVAALTNDLTTAPIELVVVIPERPLATLPAALPLPPLGGTLAARAVVRGSAIDPDLDVSLVGSSLEGGPLSLTAPIDAEAKLRYRYRTGSLRGALATEQAGQRIASTTFDLVIPPEHLTDAVPADQAFWTGRAQLVLDATPLELLSPLSSQELFGRAQGSIAIERPGWETQVEANLRLRHLQIGERPLGEASLLAATTGARLVSSAQFNDEYGALDVTAEFPVENTSLGLVLGTGTPIVLALHSKSYDAAVLSPFLGDVLSEFSGSLDGRLEVSLSPPETPDNDWNTTFRGNMTMSEGTVTPAAMGLRLEDTSLRIKAAPEGRYNVVRVTDLKAKAQSNVHNFKGNAILYFAGLDFERATFSVSQSRVPFMSEGLKLADLSGKATGTFEAKEDVYVLDLAIPELAAELPSDTDRELIDLSDNPDIEVLQPTSLDARRSSATPEASTDWLVNVQLGDSVRVKNRFINLRLAGSPTLRLQDELSMDGNIELVRGGRVQVLGRTFVIDHGAVVFDTGDVSNPHIDTAATWRAPNNVLVRATITGTAKKPHLEWSSEPPLAGGEAEIIALVLGSGSNDQGNGIAMAGAALNEALAQTGAVPWMDVYASRDTGDGQTARLNDSTWDSYTAAVQINDKLWVEGSYKRESVGPDVTREGVSGTLDWRFAPDWSVRTEVGSLGIGMDLLWQYRY